MRTRAGFDDNVGRITVACSVTRTSTWFNRPLVRGDAQRKKNCKRQDRQESWLQAPGSGSTPKHTD